MSVLAPAPESDDPLPDLPGAFDLTLPPGLVPAWKPNPGGQTAFLACPIFEVLYTGNRGAGKSEALLMAYAMHVGKGYGAEWSGLIFRRSYKELADLEKKATALFRRIFPAMLSSPGATYNATLHLWKFPQGETLQFTYLEREDDYNRYHGHAYPFVGFEELANWATPEAYLAMMSCCRSSHPGIPRLFRANTNPYGPGKSWIKQRFQLPQMLHRVIREPGLPARTSIQGSFLENAPFVAADPTYLERVRAACPSREKALAWIDGSWEGASGGFFDDLWDPQYHVIDPFPIPPTWRVQRSFDWGSARPFSVGWWALSDGCDVRTPQGLVLPTTPGDLFRIGEWYGWSGSPNEGLRMLAAEVAEGILVRDARLREAKILTPEHKVLRGPADSAIFAWENGNSIADDMRRAGVSWDPANKSAGSRRQGWEQMRRLFKHALPPTHPAFPIPPRQPGEPREDPCLRIFRTCDQFIRTIPALPTSREDPEDVDTHSEDHIGDDTRYLLGHLPKELHQGDF